MEVFAWFLRLLENYLKRASYGPSSANEFAVCTPVALHCFYNSNSTINYCEGMVVAYANA